MKTAGEGGAWGIALLAAYLVQREKGESLEDYLENRVFAGMEQKTLAPDPADEAGFDALNSEALRRLDTEGDGTSNARTRQIPRVMFREESKHLVKVHAIDTRIESTERRHSVLFALYTKGFLFQYENRLTVMVGRCVCCVERRSSYIKELRLCR